MPIRFRCSRCNRLLGIARRKAGAETTCPHCASTIMVPKANDDDDERTHLDDIDDLLNPMAPVAPPAPVMSAAPVVATRTAPPPMLRSAPKPEPIPLDERPLFERDLDAVLGASHPGIDEAGAKPKASATSGLDAMSLDAEAGKILLSPQKATGLVVAVVVLLALAFVAGFLIASR